MNMEKDRKKGNEKLNIKMWWCLEELLLLGTHKETLKEPAEALGPQYEKH